MTMIDLPNTTLNIIGSNPLVGLKPQRILVVGQLNGGSATPGALVENIQNDSSEQALFGQSFISEMIRNVKRYNQNTQVDAIGLSDDGGGSAAAGAFVFSGTATANGEIELTVGSGTDYTFTVAVADGDAASTVATAAAAAINASDTLPVTATPSGASCDLEFNNAGTVGNDTPLALNVDGDFGITATITAFTGGTGDPTLTGILDVIEGIRYQTVIWPYSDDIDFIKDFLDGRFNVENDVLDGVAIVPYVDTFANLLVEGDSHNSQSVLILGSEPVNNDDYKGPDTLEFPYAVAAQVGSLRALRLTPDAVLSRFLTTTAPADQFGGMAISTLPYFNTKLPEIEIQASGVGFTQAEIKQLKDAGVSVVGNDRARASVIMGEMFTTYKTDGAGNPDQNQFGPLNNVDAMSSIREYYFNNYKARFAQSRLTGGVRVARRDIVDQELFEAFSAELYGEMAALAIVETGETEVNGVSIIAEDFYSQNLFVEISTSEGKITTDQCFLIVTQTRKIVGTMKLSFSS